MNWVFDPSKDGLEMSQSAHDKAVAYLLLNIEGLALRSILAYGSYARGDYRPDSDVDLLVVLDSGRYRFEDLKKLVWIEKSAKKSFGIKLNMDVMLDSEIELWNKGVLLEGHSYIDPSFYGKEGRVLYGEDIRTLFRLPQDLKEKAVLLLGIIESEFKRLILGQEAKKNTVPHWLTGWLIVTYLNTMGITEVTSFRETCKFAGQTPLLAGTAQLAKYRERKELKADEFLDLQRMVLTAARSG